MDLSSFFNSRRGLLLNGVYPQAHVNTQYNSINDVNHYFRIRKYRGCFCSLKEYPINMIVNETSNHSLWRKFALFISNVIFQCSYSDYYIIRRITNYENESEYKLPYHRVKISLIASNILIHFILTLDSTGPLIAYNMHFKKDNDYSEIINYLNKTYKN